eukprot:CAMPEP_0197909068 /NCGR_PEP_ID=MMETSP1439-20131203/68146_1 /TAXON_ID=66791 /ORGANISM="Gonyaulax spinifera, Strain CCMP409" /LENGTH=147 /DNA_ID=CAMNT_0043530615 /DNA_START=92 /DNA_END=531 /DNA_ORIENTATION=+
MMPSSSRRSSATPSSILQSCTEQMSSSLMLEPRQQHPPADFLVPLPKFVRMSASHSEPVGVGQQHGSHTSEDVDFEGTAQHGDQPHQEDSQHPDSWQSGVTTLMIQNLERRMSRRAFLDELESTGFKDFINFLHVPVIGVGTRRNRG